MHKNKLLILVAVVILISAGGYALLNSKSLGLPQDSASDSLLYFKDEELGISFKHPKYLTAQAMWDSEGGETSGDKWRRINLSYMSEDANDDFGWFTIEEKTYPVDLSESEMNSRFRNQLTESAIEIGSADIDGSSAVIYGIPDSCESAPGFSILINRAGNHIQITQLSNLESDEYVYNVETILKTLKFLPNKEDTENVIPNLYYPDLPDGLECE